MEKNKKSNLPPIKRKVTRKTTFKYKISQVSKLETFETITKNSDIGEKISKNHESEITEKTRRKLPLTVEIAKSKSGKKRAKLTIKQHKIKKFVNKQVKNLDKENKANFTKSKLESELRVSFESIKFDPKIKNYGKAE